MKTKSRRVARKYRDMTERQKRKLPLLEQYLGYFNEYRGAGIEIIGDAKGELRVRYFNGDEVRLPDVLSWCDLFSKLNEMHPRVTRPVKDQDLS